MTEKTYDSDYHRRVAMVDLGIYNWKRHSTGYLLKMLRSHYRETSWWYDDHDRKMSFWENQWAIRVRDELAKRPHITNKRERRNRRERRRA